VSEDQVKYNRRKYDHIKVTITDRKLLCESIGKGIVPETLLEKDFVNQYYLFNWAVHSDYHGTSIPGLLIEEMET